MTPPAVERPLSALVRRLREVQVAEGFDDLTSEEADERTIAEAADAIEALEKENAALKKENARQHDIIVRSIRTS